MYERVVAMKTLFTSCAQQYNDMSVMSMQFECTDRGNKTDKIYSMCYDLRTPERKDLCGIDWVFHSWPSASIYSFQQVVAEITSAGLKTPVVDKVGWYGNIHSPLPDTVEYRTRPLLKQLGGTYPDLLDIVHVAPVNRIIGTTVKDYLSIPEMVKQYSCLIDIGGNGYSGRLKLLLFSLRPLLLVERFFVEYFHDDLIPYVHYIPVKMDLSDLIEKVHWVRNNKEAGEQIAVNAYRFASLNFTKEKILERIYTVHKLLNT